MPSGLVHQYDCVGAWGNGVGYLGQVQRHGFGVAEGQDEPCTLAVLRADRAEDIGRFRPLILRGRRSRSAPGPTAGDLIFLANASLVLPPYLYGCALRKPCFDLCQLGGEAFFLKSSMASSFWAWWRGRAVSFT